MSRTITVRFKNGRPVSAAKDPKRRQLAEDVGAAFLDAVDNGGDASRLVTVNPSLDEESKAAARALLRMYCGRKR